jgi:hypothetical protein
VAEKLVLCDSLKPCTHSLQYRRDVR